MIKLEKSIDYENVDEKIATKKHQWNCGKCKAGFETSRLLHEHRRSHRKRKDDVQYSYKYDEDRDLFICFNCDVKLSSKEEMEKHVLVHEDKFICIICNQNFAKPYEYTCHLFNHDKSKGFRCPFCKYGTSTRTIIKNHINSFHLRKFIYRCSLCGKGFNNCSVYKEHGNVHEGIKPYRCVVCNKEFAFSSYLIAHQVRNHKVTIEGMIDTNQIKCHICPKSFAPKNRNGPEKLRLHYRIHNGEKPFKCDYCEKTFKKSWYRVEHERIHTGEKPYECPFCGKGFSQRTSMVIHSRGHTGEKPYLCYLCNKGFAAKSMVAIHFKSCRGNVIKMK